MVRKTNDSYHSLKDICHAVGQAFFARATLSLPAEARKALDAAIRFWFLRASIITSSSDWEMRGRQRGRRG